MKIRGTSKIDFFHKRQRCTSHCSRHYLHVPMLNIICQLDNWLAISAWTVCKSTWILLH